MREKEYQQDLAFRDGFDSALCQASASQLEELAVVAKRTAALDRHSIVRWLDGFLCGFGQANGVGAPPCNDFSATLIVADEAPQSGIAHYFTHVRRVSGPVRVVPHRPKVLMATLRACLHDRLFQYIPPNWVDRRDILNGQSVPGVAQTMAWRAEIVDLLFDVMLRIVPEPSGFKIECNEARNAWDAVADWFALISGKRTVLLLRFEQFD